MRYDKSGGHRQPWPRHCAACSPEEQNEGKRDMPRSRKKCIQEGGLGLQKHPHLHFLPIVTTCKTRSHLQSYLGCSVVNVLS